MCLCRCWVWKMSLNAFCARLLLSFFPENIGIEWKGGVIYFVSQNGSSTVRALTEMHELAKKNLMALRFYFVYLWKMKEIFSYDDSWIACWRNGLPRLLLMDYSKKKKLRTRLYGTDIVELRAKWSLYETIRSIHKPGTPNCSLPLSVLRRRHLCVGISSLRQKKKCLGKTACPNLECRVL